MAAERHFYEVGEGNEPGMWAVACATCSEKANHWVYPCLHDRDNDERLIPTNRLYTPEKVQDMLNEILADMVKDGVIAMAPPGRKYVPNVDGTPMLVRKIEDVHLESISLDLEPNAFGESLHIVPKEDTDG